MNHLTTAPFSLKRFDVCLSALQGISHVLIVGNTEDPKFDLFPTVYVLPLLPFHFAQQISPLLQKHWVHVPGGPGTFHHLPEDMWIATNLGRAMTKSRIRGHERICSMNPSYYKPAMDHLSAQLPLL